MRLGPCCLTCLIWLCCHGPAGQAAPGFTLVQRGANEERAKDHLTLAAAYLEKGDDGLACEHLGLYLLTNPEHRNARYYHAELLMKLGRHHEARGEFEQVIRREQEQAEPDGRQLVHCHTRLMEIGVALEIRYLVHLHRGIGLTLLARQRANLDDQVGVLCTEVLLCKAAAELGHAHDLRPGEARCCWYLHLAWRQLAQHAAARRWLVEARRHAPFSDLTPAEHRDLLMASGDCSAQPGR